MPDKRSPFKIIENLIEERQSRTDAQILAELKSLPILPDEDAPAWNSLEAWDQTYLYLALAEIAASRKLHDALPLLFERASYGDPGEILRGLRHRLEDIVKPEWGILTEVCLKAATFPQPGARLWAMDELGILRDRRSLQILIDSLRDEKPLVREVAVHSLGMLCQTNPEWRETAIEALQKYVEEQPLEEEKQSGLERIEYIRGL